jgi:hypothetical protein
LAQHDQVDVLDLHEPAAANQQLQQGYEDEVDEGEEHPAMRPEPTQSCRSGRSTILAPFRVRRESSLIGGDVGH